jgi:hypothetical protein
MKINRFMKLLSVSVLLGFMLSLSVPAFAGYTWTPHDDSNYGGINFG